MSVLSPSNIVLKEKYLCVYIFNSHTALGFTVCFSNLNITVTCEAGNSVLSLIYGRVNSLTVGG